VFRKKVVFKTGGILVLKKEKFSLKFLGGALPQF